MRGRTDFVKVRNVWTLLVCLAVCAAGARGADEMEAPATSKPADKTKPATKLYRYKGQKVAGAGGSAQSTVLLLEDLISGRSDNLHVAPEKPAVIDVVKDLAPGTPIEVLTERHKGRPVVVGINTSPLAPGEDRPNVYVLVDWDRKKQSDGKPIMAVKLRKFGREFIAVIPLTHNRQTDDWQPPGSVENTLGRVERGNVVEAVLKPGNPPVVRDLLIYRPPEQGKFIEFTQKELDGGTTAAAFTMLARDGVTVTVTLPGVPKVVNGTKVLAPDPNQLRKVQSIKPDSEIEITLMPGDRYILRDIKVLGKPASPVEPKS